MDFLLEPHCHSAEVSVCSQLMAAQLVNEIKNAGYDGLIVTDHYNPEIFTGYEEGERFKKRLEDYFFNGYRHAREEGEKVGLRVLPGLELRTKAGPEDYLIYGITPEELSDLGCLTSLPIEKTRRMVNELGGLFMQAHPFRGYLRCMEPAQLDGVEICNANPRHDSHNETALAFAKENQLLRCAGSDVHQVGDAGSAGMRLPFAPTVKGFAEAIRNGSALCVEKRGDEYVAVRS